jgi:agmatine deiminase
MPDVRFPAEWEPQAACWTAWPHLAKEWGQELAPARRAILEMCRAVGRHQTMHLVVRPGDDSLRPEELPKGVEMHRLRFGDIWLRDTGPIFVWRDGKLEATCFRFNGWGGKYDLDGDQEIGPAMAETIAAPMRRVADFIVEGGALESDGKGTLLTTESCLLNKNRNPGVKRESVEKLLGEVLGVEKTVWLKDGLANDHTDGHIDNLARFVGGNRVVCMAPNGSNDPNRDVLQDIQKTLRQATASDGSRFEVLEVPSPGRIADDGGKPIPASYMNFVITNGTVAVPTYGVSADDKIVSLLTSVFPDRNVVAIDSHAILSGGGSLHCITCNQPKNP